LDSVVSFVGFARLHQANVICVAMYALDPSFTFLYIHLYFFYFFFLYKK